MQDNITAAITLVREIDHLEAQLKGKRESLRLLVGTPTAKKPAKARAPKAKINISATVRSFIAGRAGLGTKVPEILDTLKLRDHEATVRAVLKKDKAAGKLVNVNGFWAAAIATTQKSPAVSNGAPHIENHGGHSAAEDAARAAGFIA